MSETETKTHIHNGARDNASGVAALLAIAEAMTAVPPAPRRTVLFAAVAGEEAGLLGSRFLAANPPVPAGRFAADINAVPDPFPELGEFYRLDQLSLARIGVPGVYLKAGTDMVGRPAG